MYSYLYRYIGTYIYVFIKNAYIHIYIERESSIDIDILFPNTQHDKNMQGIFFFSFYISSLKSLISLVKITKKINVEPVSNAGLCGSTHLACDLLPPDTLFFSQEGKLSMLRIPSIFSSCLISIH